MNIYNNLSELGKLNTPVYIAIGVFDGVHKGHQKLLNRCLENAKKNNGIPAVVSFNPHPSLVFRPERAAFQIQDFDNKKDFLKSLGFEHLIVFNFDKAFAMQEPDIFISNIISHCSKLKKIIVGENWRFGKNRKGDHNFLKQESVKHNFEVEIITSEKIGDRIISSTEIRKHIRKAEFDDAEKMLGRAFSITRNIHHGNNLGKKLGFPTANMDMLPKQLPPNGVYAVYAIIDGKTYNAIANVGVRPTLQKLSKNDNPDRFLEVHLLNHNQDLYNMTIEILFHKFIRLEKKFDNLHLLQDQISKDVIIANNIFQKNGY